MKATATLSMPQSCPVSRPAPCLWSRGERLEVTGLTHGHQGEATLVTEVRDDGAHGTVPVGWRRRAEQV